MVEVVLLRKISLEIMDLPKFFSEEMGLQAKVPT